MSQPLEIGTAAPSFALPNQDGTIVRRADFAGKWLVLYFYPEDDSPACTTQACDFTERIGAFAQLSACVVGISPDSAEAHAAFRKKHRLAVELLSDPDKKVMTAYHAYGRKQLYGREVTGVIRSTVVIDPNGKIAFHWPGIKAGGHAERVRQKLVELTSRSR